MIEEILPGFYRAQIPLPESPLKFLNSYYIRGSGGRNLVVDTGLNRDECRAAVAECFRRLAFDPAQTDFFITHFHADHVGLAKELAGDRSTVFLNAPDAELLGLWTGWESLFPAAESHGFPLEDLRRGLERNPTMAFRGEDVGELTPVADGQVFEVGDYELRCVSTPGHSPGHLCLYEPARKLLLSGDHLLDEITPNIGAWRKWNALKAYLESLDKVAAMDVERVLPGHRSLFPDHRRRISELKKHHDHRLAEALELVSNRERTAYELASEMTWDLAGRWERWPFTQRWFATGEALSHLYYLEGEGAIEEAEVGGRVVFRRC